MNMCHVWNNLISVFYGFSSACLCFNIFFIIIFTSMFFPSYNSKNDLCNGFKMSVVFVLTGFGCAGPFSLHFTSESTVGGI